MTRRYRIVEMFPAIQGEGHFVGTPAVFVRFAGCNLDCEFCDTPQKITAAFFLTAKELAEEVVFLCNRGGFSIRHLVFTGGEPLLQLDSDLILAIRGRLPGIRLQVETNGETRVQGRMGDIECNCWVTWSPKHPITPSVRPDEVKVLWPTPWGGDPCDVLPFVLPDAELLIQPTVDSGGLPTDERLEHMIRWLEAHPGWRLSIQLHKIFNWR